MLDISPAVTPASSLQGSAAGAVLPLSTGIRAPSVASWGESRGVWTRCPLSPGLALPATAQVPE